MSDGNNDPPPPNAAAELALGDIYAAVAARRLQFDNLLWQVPVFSLTAQAFLFTIALSPVSSRYARTIACLLSCVTTFLALQLMTRHRQAEITDAKSLAEIEDAGRTLRVHGLAWKKKRDKTPPDAGMLTILASLRGYQTWAWGLAGFGLAALITLTITWARPEWLSGGDASDARTSQHDREPHPPVGPGHPHKP